MTARVRSWAVGHTELLGLAIALVGVIAFTGIAPRGIYGLGLVGGSSLALEAIGIVLIYRANRVINFAQFQLGAVAGLLFVQLIQRRTVLVALRAVCPPCVPLPGSSSEAVLRVHPEVVQSLGPSASDTDVAVALAPGSLVQLNYWVSALIALLVAVLLTWALYAGIIRRFIQAPRLVLTVITIAAGDAAVLIAHQALGFFFPRAGQSALTTGADVQIPVRGSFRLDDTAVFNVGEVATIVVLLAVAVGLTLFMRLSSTGIAMRASSDNASRAQTLGINVSAIASRAWLMAGALSGVAALLLVGRGDAQALSGYDSLVRALAAAVAGGFVSLPLTVLGALVLGVMEQTVLFKTNSTAVMAAILLAFIVLLLLAQRRRSGRAEFDVQGAWEASREIRPVPSQLRRVGSVRRAAAVATLVVGGLVVGFPFFMSPGQLVTATTTMSVVIVALSLLILTGWAGQISLGQMAFGAIGAWAAAVSGLPMVPALVLAALAGGVTATLVGFPALRLRGLHLAVATLALGLATRELFLGTGYLGARLPDTLARPVILGVNFDDDKPFYYMVTFFTAVAILAVMGLRRSRTARALIASKDNEVAAQAFGINLLRARLTAFAISGMLAAFGGGLLAFTLRAVDPRSFDPTESVRVFLLSVLGGLGSLAGPILGAVYGGLLDLARGSQLDLLAAALATPGVGVVFMYLLAPGGLTQIVFGVRDAFLRRVASRNRILVPSLVGERETAEDHLPMAPLTVGGVRAYVPPRYRLGRQWMVAARARGRGVNG